uniref:CDC42 small effector 1 n=5 Tax=Colubroidea TaxID=34989 RepID=A0A670ZGF9_PSETE
LIIIQCCHRFLLSSSLPPLPPLLSFLFNTFFQFLLSFFPLIFTQCRPRSLFRSPPLPPPLTSFLSSPSSKGVFQPSELGSSPPEGLSRLQTPQDAPRPAPFHPPSERHLCLDERPEAPPPPASPWHPPGGKLEATLTMSDFWHKLGCCVVEKAQPQRKRRRIDRSMIGEPMNFVHLTHIGSGDMVNEGLPAVSGAVQEMRSKCGRERPWSNSHIL